MLKFLRSIFSGPPVVSEQPFTFGSPSVSAPGKSGVENSGQRPKAQSQSNFAPPESHEPSLATQASVAVAHVRKLALDMGYSPKKIEAPLSDFEAGFADLAEKFRESFRARDMELTLDKLVELTGMIGIDHVVATLGRLPDESSVTVKPARRRKKTSRYANEPAPGNYPCGVVGEQHYMDAIAKVRPGDPVRIVREKGNPFDPHAILVTDASGQALGYLAQDSWLYGSIVGEGQGCTASILSIRDNPKGYQDIALEVSMDGTPLGERQYQKR